MKEETKEKIKEYTIIIIVCIGIMGLLFGLIYLLYNNQVKTSNLKKELCLKNNFTYIYQEDGLIVEDCYSIDENKILTNYYLDYLNKTPILSRNLR